jgi:AhpD family alkylhydroperoxidase
MRGASAFTAGERELMAAYVSKLNSCTYCASSHSEAAIVLGVERKLIEALSPLILCTRDHLNRINSSFFLFIVCIRHSRSTGGRTVVKCIKTARRVRRIWHVISFLLWRTSNQCFKARSTFIVGPRSGRPLTTRVSALHCDRQAHINTFRTLRLTALSYRRIAITNGIHIRSLKRCTCLQARRSARSDLSAIERSSFFETFEVLPCFRIVEGDCFFEPHSCNVNVPLHSSTIEVKHSEIVHGLCIAEVCRLFK